MKNCMDYYDNGDLTTGMKIIISDGMLYTIAFDICLALLFRFPVKRLKYVK
jgi:hypothetical protein